MKVLFSPRAHYLCHRLCVLCNLHTPQALTRPVCSWRALLVPPMMQFVQSPHASNLYSTRVLLARTACDTSTVSCAVYERLGPLLDTGSSGRYKVCRRCCSSCSLRTPRAFPRLGFFWPARTVPSILKLVQSSNALDLYSTRFLLAGTNCAADGTAYCAVMARLTMFQVQQSRDS